MTDSLVRDLADRAAIRRLVEGYAHGCDRREPESVAALFTEDGRLEIYEEGDPDLARSARVRTGREEIAAALTRLSRYDVTTHLLGQHTVELDGDRATGETYCMAHHLSHVDGARHDHVLSIRYLDGYRRTPDGWLIELRKLAVDWSDEREVGAAP